MRFLGRSLTGIFLLAATIGILALAGQTIYSALQERWAQESTPRTARERVFSVNVVTIEAETITPVLQAFGELRSRRTLELRASAGGTVVELADGFEEGGTVEAGQLLLRIDPTDFEAALTIARTDLSEAEADLLDARAALELAKDDLANAGRQADLRAAALTRQQDLVTRRVGTEAAVENAALAAAAAEQAVLSRRQSVASAGLKVTNAEATLSRRKVNLADAERKLADTEIRATFAGTLSDVNVVQGRLVSANEKLAQIVDPDTLEVSFRVSTAQYARLLDEAGGLVKAEVDVMLDVAGVDLVAKGRINRESAAVGEGQTGRLLFARLDQATGFRPGDFVTVSIRETPLERVSRLPASAIDAAGTVLVLGENDRLESAEVELLRRQGDDILVRARGLQGRDVVAERSPVLGAGIRVKAIRADGAAAPTAPETVALSDERRAALRAFVEGNTMMPDEAKARILKALEQDEVPASMVERLEGRMGG
ncbi:HlyD family efflux transporter periplasmic adaptor subunit [Aliiroseovarius subalbicans]|uniref:efflux RND transporter periplasmic adaptor subunit n=1 Tax=Aliiroseovarius subalbicans TaxID=2925840 RepID=UPI001F55D2B7|nr:HlyD family efflux transporter periplasmic adaptor subunit [Aliiroseovarius subalbicans]MCI2399581.1 HlyD family efflux transporter periplasmic adaptor subunit [Aliiroseovarius subalbicans]